MLYLFYNADLLDATNDSALGGSSIRYVDDVCIIINGPSVEENISILARMHEQAIVSAQQHASVFNLKKYQPIHFGPQRQKTPLVVPGHELVLTEETAVYLGVTLDWKLNWAAHLEALEEKINKRLAAINALASST